MAVDKVTINISIKPNITLQSFSCITWKSFTQHFLQLHAPVTGFRWSLHYVVKSFHFWLSFPSWHLSQSLKKKFFHTVRIPFFNTKRKNTLCEMINYLQPGLHMIAVTVFYDHQKSQLIWARQDKVFIFKPCTEKKGGQRQHYLQKWGKKTT